LEILNEVVRSYKIPSYITTL